jgi:hypothetical protein
VLELEVTGLERAVDVLERVAGVQNVAMFGRRLHVAVLDPASALREFPGLLQRAGVALNAMTVVEPTLEDAVMLLIRRAGGAVAG